MASDNCEDFNGFDEEQKAPPRPPNRKRHEEQVTDLTGKIKGLEESRAKANERLRVARESVGGFRDQRDRISAEKSDIDDKLNVINKAVETKKDALQRLKMAFVVTSEDHLDQQVKALQNDLQKNHFKATEERRIVNEIDKLNRSRRAIKDFKSLKDEQEKLKTTQKELRDRRDHLFKEREKLKRKDDDCKNEIRDLRDSLEEIKIQIETLMAEKRNITAEFRIQEMAHKKYISEKREEAKLRRKEEKEAAEAQKMKEWEEIKANEEPFEKERALVSTLIVYCQKLDPNGNDEEANHANSKGPSNDGAEGAPKNCTVYRKNDEDDVLFAGVKKNNGSSKKSAKKQKARHLKHSPETYMQFASLALQPPSTSRDVPELINKLKLKKIYFEDLAEKEKTARLLNEPSPLVECLNDDLVVPINGTNGNSEHKVKSNKKKEVQGHNHHNGAANGTFNIDQFPSLPQPAAKNGSLFDSSSNISSTEALARREIFS